MKSERQEIAAVREILDGSGLASDGMLIVHGAFRGLSHMGFRAPPTWWQRLLHKLFK